MDLPSYHPVWQIEKRMLSEAEAGPGLGSFNPHVRRLLLEG